MFDTSERPVVLIWEVTQACELACDHCRADAHPTRHPDELTTAEGKQLLDDAATEFGEGQVVVLSGGDPLKRPDLPELIDYGTDRGLRMSLTPSGTQSLTPERVRGLADAGLSRMALSFDGGDAESHDRFRGESGSFEDTVEAAEAAREAGISLQINTTVCAETVDDLPAIRDLVADLGAIRWSVFFLVPVGRGATLDPVPPMQADAVMAWLDRVESEASFALKTTEAPQYRRVQQQVDPPGDAGDRGTTGPPPGVANGDGGGPPPGVDTDGDGGGPPPGVGDVSTDDADSGPPPGATVGRPSVLAGDGFAFVSHTGEVYPSGFLPKSAGNVRESSVAALYRESDLFTALRDRDELRGKCGACEFRWVCGGSRSRAYAATGDPLAADPLCPHEPEG
ncbi:radical SAM protein [Salinirubrum litoreum]|uniref:Radical SAM protein n=1 Tax=Salinirubrum litoreum TaxID=1126234 RepID=A0ABD5RBC8_9EURY|nr:radical SAM protein [Salinirubrum litoreum]